MHGWMSTEETIEEIIQWKCHFLRIMLTFQFRLRDDRVLKSDDNVFVNRPFKGPFTRTVSVSAIVKFYHCANGDGLFDGQHWSGTHSVRQCIFNGDGDREKDSDVTCKWTFEGCLQET